MHFQALGGRNTIDSVLHRLRTEGTIRKLARGLYDYPVEHPKLGLLAPTVDAVARALKGATRSGSNPPGPMPPICSDSASRSR
jgi:hypothetical protein